MENVIRPVARDEDRLEVTLGLDLRALRYLSVNRACKRLLALLQRLPD